MTGIWDVTGTHLGKSPLELTVTIDSQRLEVADKDGTFKMVRDANGFTVTHTVGASPYQVVVSRTAAGSMAFGALPLDLAGAWTAKNAGSSDGLGCEGTLSASSASALCTGTRFPRWVGGYNPKDGTATVTKEASSTSIFGDLGGTWRLNTSAGRNCTFQFQASTLTSDCGSDLGGATITFDGSTASGSTTSGYEFAARRR